MDKYFARKIDFKLILKNTYCRFFKSKSYTTGGNGTLFLMNFNIDFFLVSWCISEGSYDSNIAQLSQCKMNGKQINDFTRTRRHH